MPHRMDRLFAASTHRDRIEAVHPAAQGRQAECAQHDNGADPARMHQAQVFDDQAAAPGAAGDAKIKSGDLQAGCHVHGAGREVLRLLHHIHLQSSHITEGHGAPQQHGDDDSTGCGAVKVNSSKTNASSKKISFRALTGPFLSASLPPQILPKATEMPYTSITAPTALALKPATCCRIGAR